MNKEPKNSIPNTQKKESEELNLLRKENRRLKEENAILKKFAKGTTRGAVKNIGTLDRLLRVAIGLGLLIWAITTSWSPVLLFFSGFAFFEAIFSWCGLYAALGKKTCPA